MKKRFEKPRIEMIQFDAEDIITTSSDPSCPEKCHDVRWHCFVIGDQND